MNKVKNYLRYAGASVVSGIAFGATAAAQTGADFMSGAATEMSTIGIQMIRVVKIALAMAGLVTRILAIINVTKGERESAGKLAWWIVGIALGYLFISMLENRMSQ